MPWYDSLVGGLPEPTQPYDPALARATRPRKVTSWPKTGTLGARPSLDVHTVPLPSPDDALEHARHQLGVTPRLLNLPSLAQVVGGLNAAIEAATPAVQALQDALNPPEPAPPSRRGWIRRWFRNPQ
jgi:hypothetical protein